MKLQQQQQPWNLLHNSDDLNVPRILTQDQRDDCMSTCDLIDRWQLWCRKKWLLLHDNRFATPSILT
jgi:hypothetical protein